MNSKIIKLKFLAISFLFVGSLWAQEKMTKVSQSIKVDKNVTVDLNTSHCNIVVDTWNKDVVEIEAYIEGEDLSNEALKNALKSWDLDIDASIDKVSIKTKGGSPNVWVVNTSSNGDGDVQVILNELKYELADSPEMEFDVRVEVPEPPLLPLVLDMSEMPELPEMPPLPELPEGMNSFKFDYEAYKKDGEKYLEEYTKQFESKYGKEFEKKMEAWGEKFGKEWSEKYAKQMEAWGERFAKQMEGQAERMEAHAERMAAHKERMESHRIRVEANAERIKERSKLLKERQEEVEKIIQSRSNSNVKKTIKIKMPKKAKLKVNVRHGEIEFATNIDNLKADLSHATFIAQSIDGSSTSINASYSPISVANWNLGELNLNYVKNAKLNNVNHLVLNAVSSEVGIDNLLGSAIVDGNIGDLSIYSIGDDFTNLSVILQNSNAVIALPKTECNVQYKGTRSHLKHPKKTTKEQDSNFSSGPMASGKSIVVNAKYSNVVMQ